MKNKINQRFASNFYSSAGTSDQPWYRSRRLSIFLVVFLVSVTIGLAYNYSRPAIYRSSATLLTSAMTPVDRGSNDADIQHVAIQRQILLGHELIAETLSRLKASDAHQFLARLTTSDIQNLLNVEPVADTNLVEIKAEGGDPKFLPLLINTWIDVYLDARAEEVRKQTNDTTRILEDELKGLSVKIDSARAELESFRKSHDISSTERNENEALARLKGLTDSLNKASEEEVKAKSTLNAIRTAISRGQAVVPEDEKGSLLDLEKRLHDLREKLADLDKKFTREYLNLQPDLKSIPQQIKELESAVNNKRQYGKNVVLTDAEMNYAAAQQTIRELRVQLDEHKKQASAFTSKFTQHDALKTDLEGLEKLYRDAQERLVQVKTSHREKYPQVTVISRAYETREPVRPEYSRDALIVIAGSLLLGLFGVWISEYLTQKKEQQPSIAVFGMQGYPAAASPAVGSLPDYPRSALGSSDQKLPEQKANSLLPGPLHRELSSHQLRILLNAANLKGKQLIGLLLSGLDIDEAVSLEPDQIDLETGTITLAGKTARTVPISGFLQSLFKQSEGQPLWDPDDPRSRVDLSAALVCAAVDSGLPDAEGITAEAIRHSYIAYLVRQGLRLSDLEHVAGHLEPDVVSSYRTYSPPQQGRYLYEIELLHPALSAAPIIK
ncbi:GumC family protein [Nitrosovibrio tenuis]|nr:integrase [Nitrosovibrio tenuis]